jgi:hypothetical protein
MEPQNCHGPPPLADGWMGRRMTIDMRCGLSTVKQEFFLPPGRGLVLPVLQEQHADPRAACSPLDHNAGEARRRKIASASLAVFNKSYALY